MNRTKTSSPRSLNRMIAHASVCLLLSVAGNAFAELDIVNSSPEDEAPVYVLKDTATGEVHGTFWDPAKGISDYEYESSIVPDFFWSKDRAYLAVSLGGSANRGVTLYKVVGNSLKGIEGPQLSEEQWALVSMDDSSAEGTDVERWQSDGTLLLRYWAVGRVTSDTETPKELNLWADVEIRGTKAVVVGTSTEKPSAPPTGAFPNPAPPAGETLASKSMTKASSEAAPAEADTGFSADRLAGVHQVVGHNPDGSVYKGKVEIRVVNGIVGLEWKIGDTVSHGQGLLVGQTLGVALDDGIALYKLVGQSEGQSLIGYWSVAGSSATNKDAILIGNAEMTESNFETERINGKYLSLCEVKDGQVESNVTIAGGEIAKKVEWKQGEEATKCQGLALSDGFAVLTPGGISVFEKHLDNNGEASMVGAALTHEGETHQETLIPVE